MTATLPRSEIRRMVRLNAKGLDWKEIGGRMDRDPRVVKKYLEKEGLKITFKLGRKTPERKVKVALRLNAKGWGNRRIGRKLGISGGTVGTILRAHGLRSDVRAHKPVTDAFLNRLKSHHAKKETTEQIAAAMKKPYATIIYHLIQLGLKSNRDPMPRLTPANKAILEKMAAEGERAGKIGKAISASEATTNRWMKLLGVYDETSRQGKKPPAEAIKRMNAMRLVGETFDTIQDKTGYTHGTIRKHTAGTVPSVKVKGKWAGGGNAVSNEDIQSMRERRINGGTQKEIAAEFEISVPTVKKYTGDVVVPEELRHMGRPRGLSAGAKRAQMGGEPRRQLVTRAVQPRRDPDEIDASKNRLVREAHRRLYSAGEAESYARMPYGEIKRRWNEMISGSKIPVDEVITRLCKVNITPDLQPVLMGAYKSKKLFNEEALVNGDPRAQNVIRYLEFSGLIAMQKGMCSFDTKLVDAYKLLKARADSSESANGSVKAEMTKIDAGKYPRLMRGSRQEKQRGTV
ncbi:MAG TPA: hypothetical protein VMV00_00125 [Candidatus Baltobacteraceae bacterium]|nr:hypothetical protein [Candidatus Baltobacteraceae bacterium]